MEFFFRNVTCDKQNMMNTPVNVTFNVLILVIKCYWVCIKRKLYYRGSNLNYQLISLWLKDDFLYIVLSVFNVNVFIYFWYGCV